MRVLLVATSNEGKLREIRGILVGVDVELRSLADLPPMEEPEETGATFAENARLKAAAYAQATGLPTVADDSGLEVVALDGAPGVWSARFPGATFPEKFRHLFQALDARGVDTSDARFVCAAAIAAADGRILFEAIGTVDGRLTREPRGAHGFGYDPIFFYPLLGRTLAEMPEEEKARLSHRGAAFARVRDWLAHGAQLE